MTYVLYEHYTAMVNASNAVTKYETHDNGGRPFQVYIDSDVDTVIVYKSEEQEPLLRMRYERLWIADDVPAGNSVLIYDGTSYVFVGWDIRRFSWQTPIVGYGSPVRGSDVAYPYARDAEGNYLLMIEYVVLTRCSTEEDPYQYYYRHDKLTTDLGRVPPMEPPGGPFRGITEFFCGDESYTMTYCPFPAAEYDRLTEGDTLEMSVIQNECRRVLSKADYVEIITAFGEMRGFRPLETEVLVPRQ